MKGFFALGKDDQFAVAALDHRDNPLASITKYAKPSFEPFYSHHGFAYPLTNNTVPLEVVVDDLAPISSKLIDTHDPIRRYLLVDHNGRLWRVLIQPDHEGSLIISHGLVFKTCGWWSMDASEHDEYDEDQNLLTGFLYTDPSQKDIDQFFLKYHARTNLVWMNIPDIVKKLNEEYPRIPKSARMTKSERLTRRSIMKLVDDALLKAKLKAEGLSDDDED